MELTLTSPPWGLKNGTAAGFLHLQAKIRDFDAVKLWAPYYEKILYEDMLVGNGLRDWLKSLETL